MNDEQLIGLEKLSELIDTDSAAAERVSLADVRAELKRRGIDTTRAKEKLKMLLSRTVSPLPGQVDSLETKRADDTQSVRDIGDQSVGAVDGLKKQSISIPGAGVKVLEQFVHGVTSALAAGLADFLVPSPFGGRQAVAMRGGSGGGLTWKLRVPSLGVRIVFRYKDALGDKAFARVISLSDAKTSGVLDEGIVIAGGTVVGRFHRGHAEFTASALAGQIGLRDPQGKPLEVEIESAS